MTDEMDLAARALRQAPPDPATHAQARSKLWEHINTLARGQDQSQDQPQDQPQDEFAHKVDQQTDQEFTGIRFRPRTKPLDENNETTGRGRHSMGMAGLFGGLGAAASAAIVLGVSLSGQDNRQVATTTNTSSAPAAPGLWSTDLIAFASHISSAPTKPAGNASLIVRSQKIGKHQAVVSYDLFTDDGAYYSREDRRSLGEAVRNHEDLSGGVYAREIKAAVAASITDPQAARAKMINAVPNPYGLGLPAGERQKIWDKSRADVPGNFAGMDIYIPPHPPTGAELDKAVNNLLWINSVDALTAGAGDPRVRVGVLRLLSTISDVDVQATEYAGKPALLLTAGSQIFGGSATEDLVVDAESGVPLTSTTNVLNKGADSSISVFTMERVDVSDIIARDS